MRALVTKDIDHQIHQSIFRRINMETPDTSTLLMQGQGKKQDVPLPVGMENAHPWLCGQVAGCLASAFGGGGAEVFWKYISLRIRLNVLRKGLDPQSYDLWMGLRRFILLDQEGSGVT